MRTDKILIISFTFPPKPGVGGRRWAKFAKYLYKKGSEFSVITSENHENSESNWTQDTISFLDKIHVINSGYPKLLKLSPKTFLRKVLYRLNLISVKLRSNGQYYDQTIFWKKQLLDKVEELIELGHTTIIATGAPFHYLSVLSELHKTYPQIKLIADIRDPWIHSTAQYNYHKLSKKRFARELAKKQKVVEYFDKIITVNKVITEDFKERYPLFRDKFKTISNGFDTVSYTHLTLPTILRV